MGPGVKAESEFDWTKLGIFEDRLSSGSPEFWQIPELTAMAVCRHRVKGDE